MAAYGAELISVPPVCISVPSLPPVSPLSGSWRCSRLCFLLHVHAWIYTIPGQHLHFQAHPALQGTNEAARPHGPEHKTMSGKCSGTSLPGGHLSSGYVVIQGKMEMARDLAAEMAGRGEGVVLDQFGNADNPLAHFRGTGAARSNTL
jgi:hypothetical protein